jgi:geranylgeranyl pyrophosphate synthase
MLSKVLNDVTERTYLNNLNWVKNYFSDDLLRFALDAIKLKEDYERALFVRIGYQTVNINWHQSIDAMTAIELLDSSLLIVDDIVDNSEMRMGKKSIHKSIGIENAIMLANIFKSLSVIALTRSAKNNNLNQIELAELIEFVESVYNEMYLGEYLDLKYENKSSPDIDIDDYLDIIKRTTGLHFGMAIKMGALLGKGSKRIVEDLWEIGNRAGMILQIRDDFVDYINAEDITHKPSFGDFERKKHRLPRILAHKYFPREIEILENAFLNESTKRSVQYLVSHPKIRKNVHNIIAKIYSDTDVLINKINSKLIRELLIEYFELIRGL